MFTLIVTIAAVNIVAMFVVAAYCAPPVDSWDFISRYQYYDD